MSVRVGIDEARPGRAAGRTVAILGHLSVHALLLDVVHGRRRRGRRRQGYARRGARVRPLRPDHPVVGRREHTAVCMGIDHHAVRSRFDFEALRRPERRRRRERFQIGERTECP